MDASTARLPRTARSATRGGGFLLTRLRLISGLTLFTFITTHLVNHALGLVSLDVMLAGQRVFIAVWHSLPGSLLLLAAALTHLSLVLYKQVVRPTLRMPPIEAVRILLGIVTLAGVALHTTPMVVERLVSGNAVRYPDFIQSFIDGSPMVWNQLVLVTAAWTHGCIGLHLWLRMLPQYRKRFALLLSLAVLVPVLSLLGVLAAARELEQRAPQAQGSAHAYGSGSYSYSYGTSGASGGYGSGGSEYSYGEYSGSSGYGSGGYGSGGYGSGGYGSGGYGSGSAYGGGSGSMLDGLQGFLGGSLTDLLNHAVQSFYGITLVVILLLLLAIARVVFLAWERRHGLVAVRYPNGRVVRSPRGASVLDISRIGSVPHASVCGGRGRCSTCRIHVDAGWENLPEPLEAEQRVLSRIRAPERVRLACQLCPVQDVAVTPLLPPDTRAQDTLPESAMTFGAEQEIVILFADLRGFTQLSESKLPYDVVHILNQYFAEMGEAIESAGGYLDKFIGDGIMALFGLRQGGVQDAARSAIKAARVMGERLVALNERLAHDLAKPLKLGIGIHVGQSIVGQMGYRRATSLTAIGDSVNVASRLESATKDLGCELLMSVEVAERGSFDLPFPVQQITVRGRESGLNVYVVKQAKELPAV